MNCENVQELLPLYASRDLEETRLRLINAHVQSCAECSRLVGEYDETSRLLQEFVPPAFSETVYSGIRQNVLRRIEPAKSHGRLSTLTGLFASAFQPRLGWAVATALILAVGLFAGLLVTNRSSDDKSRVEVTPSKNEAVASSSPVAGEDDPASITTKPVKSSPPAKRRIGLSEEPRSSLAAIKHPELQIRSEAALESNKVIEPSAIQSPEKVFRLEMQTKDPNIRIIWLTPQPTKHDSPNKISRGV